MTELEIKKAAKRLEIEARIVSAERKHRDLTEEIMSLNDDLRFLSRHPGLYFEREKQIQEFIEKQHSTP